MTVQITDLLGTYGSEWHLLSAASFLLMSVLLVFFALQRYFVQGLLAGSVIAPHTLVNLVPHTHWDREWYLPFRSACASCG